METASSSSMPAITCACAPNQLPITSPTMGSRRPVENLPQLRDKLAAICDNYLSAHFAPLHPERQAGTNSFLVPGDAKTLGPYRPIRAILHMSPRWEPGCYRRSFCTKT